MKCILLAAGTSGRILSISKGNPKPLIKIKKKTLIERNILWLKTFGIKDITINLFFKPQLIINEVKKFSKEVQIHFSLEKKLLGTAGAVKKIQNQLGTNFLVIYSDNLLSFDIKEFINFHLEKKANISIALYNPSNSLFSGLASSKIELKKNREIKSFTENRNKNLGKNNLVNTGAYIINKKILKYIPKNKFYDFSRNLFPKLINKKFYGYVIEKEGYCLGVDTPKTYKMSLRIIKKEKLFS